METLPQNAVLLLIDVQKAFEEPSYGSRNNPGAEENMARLLDAWRNTERPVFHVQHLSLSQNSPLRAELPGSEIQDAVKPIIDEPLIQKHVNSAFIGTDLEEHLRAHSYDTLVIVGLTTPHCVSTTARMAGNLGFRTYVVSDATAAFEIDGIAGRRYTAEEVHDLSLATLRAEFAAIVDTESLLHSLI
jgi:nicotinamidase-related amidase